MTSGDEDGSSDLLLFLTDQAYLEATKTRERLQPFGIPKGTSSTTVMETLEHRKTMRDEKKKKDQNTTAYTRGGYKIYAAIHNE
jgi:hypothetical protein